jgi:hypothetical protein
VAVAVAVATGSGLRRASHTRRRRLSAVMNGQEGTFAQDSAVRVSTPTALRPSWLLRTSRRTDTAVATAAQADYSPGAIVTARMCNNAASTP